MAALATGAIAALLAIDGGGEGSRAFAFESPKPATNPAERALRTGGQLSVIGIPTSGRQQPTAKSDGWYGLSTVGQSGALRYLVRCPGQVRWCGWVESLDWSPNGRWLALSVTSISTPNPYNGIHVVDVVAGVDRQLTTHCIFPECELARPRLVARQRAHRLRHQQPDQDHRPRRLRITSCPNWIAGRCVLPVLVARRRAHRLREPTVAAWSLVGLRRGR